jgi:hypothetical protein
MECCY